MIDQIPVVSMIVPVYNVEKYLGQCLESIRTQSYKDFELILIDDGSTDSSPELCDRFGKENHEFGVSVRHFSNGGLSTARNRGLEVAKGKYITFADSDDFLSSKYIERLVHAAEKENADIVSCTYMEYDSAEKQHRQKGMETVLNNKEALRYLCRNKELKNYAHGKLYRKELFENVRFPEGRVFEDIATIYKAFYKAEKTVCIDDALYYYRIRRDGITGKSRENFLYACQRSMAYIERYKNLGPRMPELVPVMLPDVVYSIGLAAMSYHGETNTCEKEIESFASALCKGMICGSEYLDWIERQQMKLVARKGMHTAMGKFLYQFHRVYHKFFIRERGRESK